MQKTIYNEGYALFNSQVAAIRGIPRTGERSL